MPEYEAPTFIEEEMPAIERKNRGSYPWEEHYAGIKEVPTSSPRRVATFDGHSQANARASAIRKRWAAAVPLEHISTTVRQVAKGPDAGKFGVYLAHHGTITQAKRDELNAAAKLRGDRVRAARLNREAPVAASKPSGTAAERLAAAKAAKSA